MNHLSKRLFATSSKQFVENITRTQKTSTHFVKSFIPLNEFNHIKYTIRNFNLRNFELLEKHYKIFKLNQKVLTANDIEINTSETFHGLRNFTKVLQSDTKDNSILVGNYVIWDAHLKLVQSFSSALFCVTKQCISQLNDEHKNELPFDVERSIFDLLVATAHSDFELAKTALMRKKMNQHIEHCEYDWLICSNEVYK